MARRLTHAAAAFVLASSIGGASACANASEVSSDSTLASMAAAASVTTAIVRSYNDAVIDDYMLQALANGAAPAGAAQPCITADNRLSQRPSPLANPPYAEASIVQRDRVMRVLGAYALLVATVSRDAASADAEFAAAEFARATFALNAAANVHAQGDLFVEDRAASLAAIAATPRKARDATATRDIVARANPSVQQLIALAGADVGKRRLEAIAATQVELHDLTAPFFATRSVSVANPVLCSKPLVAVSASAAAVPQAEMSARIDALPPALRSRAERILERATALSASNFDPLFEALHREAVAATALPIQRSNVEEAAKAIQREGAAVGRAGLVLTSARL